MILNMYLSPEQAEDAVGASATTPKLPPVETASGWSMPTEASTFADNVDALYYFIVALDVFFFVVVMGAMGYFMWKYRRRSADQKTSSITHNGKIEFLWSAIPAVLLVVIFIWAEMDFMRQSVPPNDAVQIRVTGRQWYWTVDYPAYPGVQLNSSTEEPVVTMVVPKGRDVQLTMTSEDVIHSFYIPAFRIKRDTVPGRYTSLWFRPTKVGEYNVFCTEYCGDQHSQMTGVIKVVEPDEFEALLEELGRLERDEGESLEAYGARIYQRRGCNGCHSIDGSPATGPTWEGLWGRTETFADGGSLTVEGAEGENYLRQSILEPNARIVQGFAGVGMPSYQGQLDEEQLKAVIAYIKSLQ